MDFFSSDLVEQVGRTLVLCLVPTLVIPLAALGVCLVQGMMGIKEESFQYSVRVVALVAVLAVFSGSVARAFLDLMQISLR